MSGGERWLSTVSVGQVVAEHEDPGHDSGQDPGHKPEKLSEAGKRRLGGGASAMASAISVLSPFAGVDANAPSIMLVLCAAASVSPAALPGLPAAPSRVAFASGSVAGVAGQAALPAR